MRSTAVLLLTNDDDLAGHVATRVRKTKVIVTRCLHAAAQYMPDGGLIVDPRGLRPCCLESLTSGRSPLTHKRTVMLCLEAPPRVLLSLGQTVTATLADIADLGTIIESWNARARAAHAWEDRNRILSLKDRPALAESFLALAEKHGHENFAVWEAAMALRIDERRLRRLSTAWFGQPPDVILGLCRVVSLTESLVHTKDSLMSIAKAHGFPNQSAMGRAFLRYTGLSPAAFRRQALQAMPVRKRSDLSENVGCQRGSAPV